MAFHSSKNKKKNRQNVQEKIEDTPLQDIDEFIYYGKLVKTLGNRRFKANIIELKQDLLVHIRGSMGKDKMSIGDTVLVSIREFEKDKGDIIYKYSPEQVKFLTQQGHMKQQQEQDLIDNCGVVFEDDDINKDTIKEERKIVKKEQKLNKQNNRNKKTNIEQNSDGSIDLPDNSSDEDTQNNGEKIQIQVLQQNRKYSIESDGEVDIDNI